MKCSKCNRKVQESDFSINPKINQLYKNCDSCREYINKKREENKEKDKKVKEKYRKNNREKILESSKIYYQNNKEKAAKFFQDNKEKILEVRKMFIENNPDKKAVHYMRTRLCTIIRNIIEENTMTVSEYKVNIGHQGFYNLLGCSQEFFIVWIESQFDDIINWENYGEYWHIDHVYPCSKININNEEQRKMCFNWKNLQPLEKTKNISKHNKILNDLIDNHKLKAIEFEKFYEQHFQIAGNS